MKHYIYPDGTISEEPLDFNATTPLVPSFMSDDYAVINADSYEEAYEYALMQGWI